MSSEMSRDRKAEHKLLLGGRETLEVTGVTDVLNFDEQTVMLSTLCGGMEVCGSALHIRVLNTEEGVVAMEGKIDSISYYEQDLHEKSEKTGFFGRLFR